MRVAILGCGYVGLELAHKLRANGHDVIGMRRSREGCERIEATGARSIQGDVTDSQDVERVPDVDAVVFAASAGGDADAARHTLVGGIETAFDVFGARSRPPETFIYTSSTGVYGDHGGAWVDETTPIAPTGAKAEVLAVAEEAVRARARKTDIDSLIARLSGIYGPERFRIERYLTHPVTPGWRNSIHRDDAAGAISYLLTAVPDLPGVVIISDDEPVDRRVFASWLAEELGAPQPPTRNIEELAEDPDLSSRAKRRLRVQKRCNNGRLRALGYELRYPTYREGYASAIAQYQKKME